MHILFVGTDRLIFKEGTEARTRISQYAMLADTVSIIVFSKRELGLETLHIPPNIIVYPTCSRTKLGYLFDAVRLGNALDKVDIVSAQDPFECALPSLFIARTHGARLQIQMHIDAFSPHFKGECLLNRVRSCIARHTLPRADCVRVVSERIRDSLRTHRIPLRVEPLVLPVYVDTTRFETEEPTISLREKYSTHSPLILMAGRLVPQKDIPTALRAFSIFLKKVPKAGLVVVGEGSELKKLEILVKKLGLEKAVFFEGWQKDMLSYLKTSDIFFMTSTHEGYQRALGEAAAAGVPVVTTETGPVGSVYKDGDSVLSCPVGDVACLAQKLYLLVRDAGLREALVRHAKKVAHHAIAKDYEAYLAQYAKCIRECGKE